MANPRNIASKFTKDEGKQLLESAQKIIDEVFEYEIQRHKVKPVKIEQNLCIIALVGDNMKNHHDF